MKGDESMEEMLTSTEALQSGDDRTELIIRKKPRTSLADTITFQAILCVIAAIVFVVINIFDNGLAEDIFRIYSDRFSDDGNIPEIFRIVFDFLKTTPNV